VKILIDMNLSPQWVGFLENEGLQAKHWSAIGPAPATDAEIMAYALLHDHVVLTHDLDFSAILAVTHGEKPSVVQIRAEEPSTDRIGWQVVTALKQMESELDAGALLTIDLKRTRIRILPLHR